MDRIGQLLRNAQALSAEASILQRDYNNAVRFGHANAPELLHEWKHYLLLKRSAFGMYQDALMYNNNETELQTYRLTA